jgi:hypothetical protein
VGEQQLPCSRDGARNWEARMELSMRLNVLATLLSFGFLAAVVFGMV